MWIIDFFSKVGFFVSYVATFFLVLEIVRLVCTDANKREAERLLDAYTRGRETEKKQEESRKLSVDELENELEAFPALSEPVQAPQTPQRRTQRTVLHRIPTSEKTLVSEGKEREKEKERRKRSQTPTQRLRKRSDTLNSTSTSESRHSSRSKSSSTTSESRRSSRSHRDSSPESTTSKSSSRHASPNMRRSKDASLSLHRLLRSKV